ncbi:MAG: HDIG domain-containing protein [Syntrophomonas sp.]|nr:HDIG domain-containing protein [Syntrophomonas sp.]
MIKVSESNLFSNVELSNNHEYEHCISDLAQNQMVKSLGGFVHHRNVSRLDHCVHVSYLSYLLCKKLGLDYLSAARGGLLHDFYFYDSRATIPDKGIHCFCHASLALENAAQHFPLNEVEKDIIKKHMWPLTITPPKFKESYVVTFMDKYCASKEIALYNGNFNMNLPSNLLAKLHNFRS